MKQTLKLHSISLSIATAIVLYGWSKLPELKELNELLKSDLLKVFIGAVASAGLYKLTIELIIRISKKIKFVKKIFLGASYLDGTWAGFYIGSGGQVRYYVEKYEQELDTLVIRGHSYNELLQYHAWWTATSVNVDTTKCEISYMYDCKAIRDTSNHNGLAVFNFVTGNQKKAPTKLIGYSTDIHIGIRTKSMEVKISDDSNFDTDKALIKAKELYVANQNTF